MVRSLDEVAKASQQPTKGRNQNRTAVDRDAPVDPFHPAPTLTADYVHVVAQSGKGVCRGMGVAPGPVPDHRGVLVPQEDDPHVIRSLVDIGCPASRGGMQRLWERRLGGRA